MADDHASPCPYEIGTFVCSVFGCLSWCKKIRNEPAINSGDSNAIRRVWNGSFSLFRSLILIHIQKEEMIPSLFQKMLSEQTHPKRSLSLFLTWMFIFMRKNKIIPLLIQEMWLSKGSYNLIGWRLCLTTVIQKRSRSLPYLYE